MNDSSLTVKDLYEILFDEYTNEELARIRILDPRWSDVIIRYGSIKFEETDLETNEAVLSFDYEVIHIPKELSSFNQKTDEEKSDFESLIGDILIDIIEGAINDLENRTDDSFKSDS